MLGTMQKHLMSLRGVNDATLAEPFGENIMLPPKNLCQSPELRLPASHHHSSADGRQTSIFHNLCYTEPVK